jgi:tRNA pseudouridine38-40 synthase
VTLFDPEPPAGPEPPLARLKLVVAYDGRGYHGFAAQPGVKTVGGALITSLERVLRHPVSLTAAGRTDTGVHAWGQVVSFDAHDSALDLDGLQRSVNKLLGPAIVVRWAEVAGVAFDARRSARSRTYRYTVLNRTVPDPFLAATSWHVEEPLDLRALQLACDPVIGEHDFGSFCRVPRRDADASMVRRVLDARWHALGDGVLRFEITSSSFCHQMVRALVGTMVEMGRGRKRPGDMAGILRACSRAAAGDLAPPHGLCLWDVAY